MSRAFSAGLWVNIPGALPQAGNEAGPLALDDIIFAGSELHTSQDWHRKKAKAARGRPHSACMQQRKPLKA